MPNQPGPVMKALSMLALIPQPSPRMKSIVLSFGIVASAMGCTQADRFYAAGRRPPPPALPPAVRVGMAPGVNVFSRPQAREGAPDRRGARRGGGEHQSAPTGL